MTPKGLTWCLLLSVLSCFSCQLRPPVDPPVPAYQVNQEAFAKVHPSESKVVVSLADQKAWLLNRGGQAVLETDVATGVPGKDTPTGRFTVLERSVDKRSNRYGKLIYRDTGKVFAEKSWLHSGPRPSNVEFLGTPMPYWMRLTWYGVGLHVGEFPKRTRCSFGCVRVFEAAQPLIYSKTQLGTPVHIVSHSLIPSHSLYR